MLAAVLTAVLAAGLAGCAGSGEGKDGEINIVATIFPGYDFVRALIKDVDGVNLRLLIQPGTESHTFDPSVSDALSLKNCDLLVCAGGDADKPRSQSADTPSLVHSMMMYSILGELVPHTQLVYEVKGTPNLWAKSF